MSSYIVDSKTNLPLLYLKDNKKALWINLKLTYPDGIKRASFMARLANGRYVYRKDLGGLCNICNEYGYEVFDTLINIIRLNINEKETKNRLIHDVEKLRLHLRRGFENELSVNENGMLENVRKVYLNSQFKAQLLELDEYGAILVCDYKMRILPKSARETKEEFFGKRGWTLHTILVFTKKDDTNLNVHAFDHWSTDTKQDAWFTAFSFNAVFETLDPKPQWVKILSDNGGHYHNSELMTLITNWHQWYNIEVRGWYFLEPGEAKTSVDSHHAQVRNCN
ncbi:uncharacterized protein OCT59_007418 [Rhizophagus irregularis]|uniref:uncharacterized protein n=1 Tax=Rhizophagus irregularis TaxID=588596 RepID=UPI0033247255|nr:hypothetical protein OCT59_007418 [Rhizophagus irregularis]